MRCFIAVDLDHKLKQKVGRLQKELAGLDTKLVESYNLHFTLKFLGETDDKVMEKVKVALEEVSHRYQPFTISLADVGVFPNEKFIRVVWVGSESEEFAALHHAVDESLSTVFRKEKPVPHLTLARARSQKHKKELLDFVNRRKDEEICTMLSKEKKKKKSTVTNKGPIYEDVEIFELKKRRVENDKR